jgi:hypothetical protein
MSDYESSSVSSGGAPDDAGPGPRHEHEHEQAVAAGADGGGGGGASEAGSGNGNGSDGESDGDEEESQLKTFVAKFVKLDDEIHRLKSTIKPTTVQIRELSTQKRQVAMVVARLMEEHEVDTLKAGGGEDGGCAWKLTRVMTVRAKPTVAAFEQTVLTELLGGDEGRFKELQKRALQNCKPPVATLRRSGRAKV